MSELAQNRFAATLARLGEHERALMEDGKAPGFAFITTEGFGFDELGVLAISEHALDELSAAATGNDVFPTQDYLITFVHPTQTQAQRRTQEAAALDDVTRRELEALRTSARMLREIALRDAQIVELGGHRVPVLSPVGRFLVHCANIAELTKSAELGLDPAHTSELLESEETSLVLAAEAFQDSSNIASMQQLVEQWPIAFAMHMPEGSALKQARERLDLETHLLTVATSEIDGSVAHDQLSLGSARSALDTAGGRALQLVDQRFRRRDPGTDRDNSGPELGG